jgi:mono/diheme cytochrome c family protein
LGVTSHLYAQDLDLVKAQKQYNKYCAKCHGVKGRGDGNEGATLKRKPKVFTDCQEMAKESDTQLFHTVKFGGEPVNGRKSDMPSIGKALDDEDIHALVAYVRRFCQP